MRPQPPQTRALAVKLNTVGGARTAVFYPGIDGGVDVATHFSARMPDWTVYGILTAPAVPAGDSIPGMAARGLAALARKGRPVPDCVVGFSFGCFVALEAAQQLRAAGTPAPCLVLIDALVRLGSQEVPPAVESVWQFARAAGLVSELAEFASWDVPTRIAAIIRDCGRTLRGLDQETGRRLYDNIERGTEALTGYRVSAYPEAAGVVVASGSTLTRPDPALWRGVFTGRFELAVVPGTHIELMSPERAEEVADAVRTLADGSSRPSGD
ncbi:Thioesterase domain-containing protein [Micromonospora haikouensis]|uniref:Thioesterase domain-containing protein n=1 Tax=Micromonospora haikouensis TaxID=686309 RepID=A0A1C4XH09_9ACTN|nr:alpha/beta fold hydrolase [Micromonospora haikouensis]SCF07647.1 Thioesterase domain-containing protein [Micromonospora haikouensis]